MSGNVLRRLLGQHLGRRPPAPPDPSPQAHPILLEITLLRHLPCRPGAHSLLHPEAHRPRGVFVLFLAKGKSGETGLGLPLAFPDLSPKITKSAASRHSLCVPGSGLGEEARAHACPRRAHSRSGPRTTPKAAVGDQGPPGGKALPPAPQGQAEPFPLWETMKCRTPPQHPQTSDPILVPGTPRSP